MTLRDELDIQQKRLTVAIMKYDEKTRNPSESIADWIADHQYAMERWEKMLKILHSSTNIDYVMFFIAMRELSELIHTSEVVKI